MASAIALQGFSRITVSFYVQCCELLRAVTTDIVRISVQHCESFRASHNSLSVAPIATDGSKTVHSQKDCEVNTLRTETLAPQ